MNENNSNIKSSYIWREEEEKKNKVYQYFEGQRKEKQIAVDRDIGDINRGQYEDQDSSVVHNKSAESKKALRETVQMIGDLFEKPYFAHIKTCGNDGSVASTTDFLLSNCPELEKTIPISDSIFLLPFKKDTNKPLFDKLFHAYQAKNGEHFYDDSGQEHCPTLICNDEIKNAQLLNVALLYSENEKAGDIVDSDEILLQKLSQNRENPEFRNIISTLQQMQFDIIQTSKDADFAVQGCAGSGKSQIMLHRLFFFRDVFSNENWSKTLLITPTELFRHYSADLIRQYNLTSITDMSIADLYRSLIEFYDPSFKNRQYLFEMTEEYLPDEFLREVYSEENIQKIDTEIKKSIFNIVSNACQLLAIDIPEKVDIALVNELVEKLDAEIKRIESSEANKQKTFTDVENEIKQSELISQVKENSALLENLQAKLDDQLERKRIFEERSKSFDEIKKEKATWIQQRKIKELNLRRELAECEAIPKEKLTYGIPGRYAQLLFDIKDFTEGKTYREDEEYLQYLNEYYNNEENSLLELIGTQPADRYRRLLESDVNDISNRIEILRKEIASSQEIIEKFKLEANSNAEDEKNDSAAKADYTRARYLLQRIETRIFEEEVWNTIKPLKEKYEIQATQTQVDGNKKTTSRILYKSDLLFYLKIYMQLYPRNLIPEYRLICIDEGQDLHSSEYSVLRELYPDAKFNIFGDTAQTLHAGCGVNNWKKDAGVKTVFSLNKNYRNEPEIVEFCNQKFDAAMEYIGQADNADAFPMEISSTVELKDIMGRVLESASTAQKVTLIVKDKAMFHSLCQESGFGEQYFEFLDTNSSIPSQKKVNCYTIYAAKGLEFSRVLVYSKEMSRGQKIVACTRATERLYYYE